MGKAVEFDWVDAFSGKAFHGNGCVVVYNAEDWELEKRLRYVRETGLTECTFVARDGEHWRIQYYLPTREIPYAGHPTIATTWSLFKRKLINNSTNLQTNLGAIPVSIQNDWVEINAPIPRFGAKFEAPELAEIYGLDPSEVVMQPQLVEAGLSFVILLLRNQEAIDRAELDANKLRAFQDRHGLENFCEPYLATLEHEFKSQAFSLGRLLLPPPLPKEDALTGSATGMFAAWAFSQGLVPQVFTHAQGHALNRIGFAKLTLQGAQNSIKSIKLAGQAHILMSGNITI